MMPVEITILFSGILLVVASSILGNFLVLQRMSMMTDAIAHGILPGVVGAYFFAHDYNFFVVAVGAILSSFAVAGFVHFLTHKMHVPRDAAIGITFASAFSLGIVMISQFFRDVHIDAACILYGEIEYAPFELFWWGGENLGPISLWVMGGIVILNLIFVGVFWKEIKLLSFDRDSAMMMRYAPTALQLVFFALLSVTAVGALSLVGVILFISFVVVPPATARLMCVSGIFGARPSVFSMMVWSIFVGILGVVLGFFVGMVFDTSISGSMAVMNGVIFGVVLLMRYLKK